MRYNLVLLSVKGILDFSFSFLFLFIAYFYLLWSSSLSWQFVWWYMFFSHVTTAACLVFPICAWRSGIIVFFFSPLLPFFLEKNCFLALGVHLVQVFYYCFLFISCLGSFSSCEVTEVLIT